MHITHNVYTPGIFVCDKGILLKVVEMGKKSNFFRKCLIFIAIYIPVYNFTRFKCLVYRNPQIFCELKHLLTSSQMFHFFILCWFVKKNQRNNLQD